MSTHQFSEAAEFIKSIELAPISAAQVSALDVTAGTPIFGNTTFVDRGAIEYLPIPEQQTTDCLYWTLLGQLAADVKFNREIDPFSWYKEYVRVLRNAGMRTGDWTRNSANGSKAEASVDATVLRYLKPFLSPGGQSQLQQIIDALREEKNKKVLDLFNQSASDSSGANFQVSDGTVDAHLNLTIRAGIMDFRTKEQITDLLFWEWPDRDFTFFYASDTMTLAKNLADRLRDVVYNRVSTHIGGNIDVVDLA